LREEIRSEIDMQKLKGDGATKKRRSALNKE
jgi:hypothetical protein